MPLKDIIPQYYSTNPLIRRLFWARLKKAIFIASQKIVDSPDVKVVDLGCGQGVFLKLLEEKFKNIKIFGLDKEPAVAELNKNLRAEIQVADLRQTGFPNGFFDIVFCLDVLEHFKNLEEPIREIKRILKEDGLLITSCPTENLFYKLGRLLTVGTTSMEKDIYPCSSHFHKASEVEKCLCENGFKIIKRILLPPIPFLSLFSIVSFEKTDNKNHDKW
jgi:2-polyprenyl-3-methyl-5-hydroxy-6-metoxy-1,4-benzoquinol methylase